MDKPDWHWNTMKQTRLVGKQSTTKEIETRANRGANITRATMMKKESFTDIGEYVTPELSTRVD